MAVDFYSSRALVQKDRFSKYLLSPSYALNLNMNNEMKLVLIIIGLFATLSLFLSSINLSAHAQLGNVSQALQQVEGKLSSLTEKIGEFIKKSGGNVTLPQTAELKSKIKDLEKSDEYKALSQKLEDLEKSDEYIALSAKVTQIFQELKGNLTNMANTTGLANIKQQMTSNFTALVQNLEDLKNNTQFAFPNK
jgi:CRISPR/Cas system CMR-associated protein Cmr5 small subunit